MADFDKARALLRRFKDDKYLHGLGILPQVGGVAAGAGGRAALVAGHFPGSAPFIQAIKDSLAAAGVTVAGQVAGAAPNAPRADVFRIAREVAALDPEVVVTFGGGSAIDAVKAAEVLRTLGGEIDDYFGSGLVSRRAASSGKKLGPHVAIQTAASSGAHLTKYSNITDVATGQKKLIVDEAIVPAWPVFDYQVTFGAPPALTADGALDGLSHALEVLYSAAGKPNYAQVEEVAGKAIRLVVQYLPEALANPRSAQAREALGLATDLGGYAIMLGGTNGAHLTSFSLVDILSHGRACAVMNPYYTVFFAPAVERPLKLVGGIFRRAGYTSADVDRLSGRALAAARDPQLRMKLENMPVPLTPQMVNDTMGPILQAAKTGNLDLIVNV
jgi:alcohol dehydrogenase